MGGPDKQHGQHDWPALRPCLARRQQVQAEHRDVRGRSAALFPRLWSSIHQDDLIGCKMVMIGDLHMRWFHHVLEMTRGT